MDYIMFTKLQTCVGVLCVKIAENERFWADVKHL